MEDIKIERQREDYFVDSDIMNNNSLFPRVRYIFKKIDIKRLSDQS